jgi:hypothetical protein
MARIFDLLVFIFVQQALIASVSDNISKESEANDSIRYPTQIVN